MKLISRASMQWVGTLLVLFLPLVLLVVHLSSFWSLDAQYSYAWAVPLMAAFFFWEKWKTLPSGSTRMGKLLPLLGTCTAAVSLALAWLAHEAVPDWSVVNWFFALSVVSYMLSLITCWRGRSSAFQLLFPVLFILCAVPWPQRLELALVQGLMKWVANATAEILPWFDVPAQAAGNIIRLPDGRVGVDEACSGIRGLQGMLMVSLFLGEFFHIKVLKRFALVGIGCVLTLFFNVVRVSVLVYVAYTRDFEVMAKWHDPVGWSFLGRVCKSSM
jgi:exosortase